MKKLVALFTLVAIITVAFSPSVSADSGVEPSVLYHCMDKRPGTSGDIWMTSAIRNNRNQVSPQQTARVYWIRNVEGVLLSDLIYTQAIPSLTPGQSVSFVNNLHRAYQGFQHWYQIQVGSVWYNPPLTLCVFGK